MVKMVRFTKFVQNCVRGAELLIVLNVIALVVVCELGVVFGALPKVLVLMVQIFVVGLGILGIVLNAIVMGAAQQLFVVLVTLLRERDLMAQIFVAMWGLAIVLNAIVMEIVA